MVFLIFVFQVILQATHDIGPCAQYYSLWPQEMLSEPWMHVVRSLYSVLAKLPVLHVMDGEGKGQWVCPVDAILPDQQVRCLCEASLTQFR